MKPRPRDTWSRYLIGLVQCAPLPENPEDAAKMLHAAAMFAIAEELADLALLLREVIEKDQAAEKPAMKGQAL